MKLSFFEIVIIGLLVLLGGCATPEPQIVYKEKLVVVKLDKDLTQRCDVEPFPVAKEEFLKMTWKQRAIALTRWSDHLLGNLGGCSDRMETIERVQSEAEQRIRDSEVK